MNTLLKIGIIGAGRIGSLHAEHTAHRIPGAELWAVSDVNLAAAKNLATRLGCGRVYEDAQAILNDPDVDAVVICSSTDTHSPLIEAAARAGKHIFCEKPIDFDLDRIDSALNAVDAAGVTLQVGFNRRFDPNFSNVRAQIEQGAIGEPSLLHIISRDPGPPPIDYIKVSGGLFLDMTIHDFDMARFLVGAEVTRIYARGHAADPAIAAAGDIDTAMLMLEFENGVLGTIDNCRAAAYGYDQRVEVFGSRGMAWADNNTPHRTGLANEAGLHTPRPLDFFMERYTDSYVAELQAFVNCLQSGAPALVTGLDARTPVVMGLAARRSLAEGRPVALTEVG